MKLTKKQYETSQEKRNDFILGVFLFIILNGVLLALGIGSSWLLSTVSAPAGSSDVVTTVINCLAFGLNIGLIIFFALTRSWIALGMLSTIGGLLALAVILGIFAAVACIIIFAAGSVKP